MHTPGRTLMGLLLLVYAAPAAAQGTRAPYVRGEIGVAVEVFWVEARVGHALGDGPLAVDVGIGGSEGFFDVTGGLEIRTDPDGRVSVFGRLDLGGLAESGGRTYGVVNLGGGLAFRLNPTWSVRVGGSRGLPLGDSVMGPDRIYLGLEHRW